MANKELPLAKIRLDGGTQMRAATIADVVAEYAEHYKAGVAMPEPTVFFDGTDYWLANGFHRVPAAVEAGLKKLSFDVRSGTRRDAILYACGANSTHGLRRTNADKRRSVEVLLRDEEWGKKSDNWISEIAVVSRQFVASVRAGCNGSTLSEREGRDGKTYTTPAKKEKSAEPKAQQPAPAVLAAEEDEPEAEATSSSCPHGGEHEFDGDACTKCHEPAPDDWTDELRGESDDEPDPADETVGPDRDDESIEARIERQRAEMERYCLDILAHVAEYPWGPRTKQEHVNALHNGLVKLLRETVRNEKAAAVCQKCQGEGCEACEHSGYMLVREVWAMPLEERLQFRHLKFIGTTWIEPGLFGEVEEDAA